MVISYNYAVTNIEGTVKMICRNDMNANDAHYFLIKINNLSLSHPGV
jgi:hypothetical protein